MLVTMSGTTIRRTKTHTETLFFFRVFVCSAAFHLIQERERTCTDIVTVSRRHWLTLTLSVRRISYVLTLGERETECLTCALVII